MSEQSVPSNKELHLKLLASVPLIMNKHFVSASEQRPEFRKIIDTNRHLLEPAFEKLVTGIIDALYLNESDYRTFLTTTSDVGFEEGIVSVRLLRQNVNSILELSQSLYVTIQTELFGIIEQFAESSAARLTMFDRIAESCWTRFLGFSRGYLATKDRETGNLHDQKIAMMGRMTTAMAHEVRNPLASIKGFAQLLKMKLNQPVHDRNELVKYLDLSLREIDSIDQLISDILLLARKNVPRKSTHIRVELNEIVERVSTIARHMAEGSGIAFLVELPKTPLFVKGIPSQLEQVCRNLVTNSMDALSEGGTLRISLGTDPPGNEVMLSITDDGVGIPEANMEKIFEPFYTTKETGTGIGLAICKQIVDSHSGRITVETASGKGTAVNLVFPRDLPH